MAFVSLDLNPERRVLRSFGFIGLVAFGAFATLVQARWWPFRGASDGFADIVMPVLAGLAVYCGLFAAAAPAMLRPLYVILTVVTYPIGLVVSYCIVGLMFYVIFTPVALVFRIIGRDALHRRFEPQAPTYWIRREPPKTVARYFRQF